MADSQDSFIAHASARRAKINQSRRTLSLGDRGVSQPQQAPPAQAPSPGGTPVGQEQGQEEEQELSELTSSDSGDMLARVTKFVNEQKANRVQQNIARDQAVPDMTTKDGRVLETKRFMKLYMPWSLSNDGFKSRPNQ